MKKFIFLLAIPYIMLTLFIVLIATPIVIFVADGEHEKENRSLGVIHPSVNGKLVYRPIDYQKMYHFLTARGSKMCDQSCYLRIVIIDNAALRHNINPLLLFAVIGAEHSLFTASFDNLENRLNNPFNVGCRQIASGGPWCKMSLEESAGSAAKLLSQKISVDISDLYSPEYRYEGWSGFIASMWDRLFNSKAYTFKSKCSQEYQSIRDVFDWINSYCNPGGNGIYATDRNWSNNVREWFKILENNNLYSDDGAFIWPTLGTNCTSYFGEISALRNNKPHSGVDIAGNRSTFGWMVFAAHDGRVLFAGPGDIEGNYVMIEGERKRTLYAHLFGFLVKAGDFVRRGDPIGLIGSTGRSTGPHLHFGIQIDGKLVDPLGVKYYTGTCKNRAR